MDFINNVSSNYLQSVFSTLQNSGLTTNSPASSLSGIGSSPTDHQQLSPFAQIMSQLQQLQQTDPAKYQQVTQQIATNLESAGQTAQADSNTTAATQLSQLSSDFSSASSSGQLPNIQDLAQATGGAHHHHHHHHSGSADSNSDPSTSSSASDPLSQLFASLQTNGTQNSALDPTAIIFNTLSDSGITGSNS